MERRSPACGWGPGEGASGRQPRIPTCEALADAVTFGSNYMGPHTNPRRRPEQLPREQGRGDTEDIQVVMDSIRRIVRLLRVSARASERLVGISGAQLFVLQQLAE